MSKAAPEGGSTSRTSGEGRAFPGNVPEMSHSQSPFKRRRRTHATVIIDGENAFAQIDRAIGAILGDASRLVTNFWSLISSLGDGFAVILGYSLSGFVFMDHLASSINTTLPTGTHKSSRGGGPVTRTQKENPRHDVSLSGSDCVEIHPLYSSVSEYSLGSEYEQVVS
jgi:hypothetical protein